MHWKNKDVGAKWQKWYCLTCGCKYNASWGMLIEFRYDHVSSFMCAECPDFDAEEKEKLTEAEAKTIKEKREQGRNRKGKERTGKRTRRKKQWKRCEGGA